MLLDSRGVAVAPGIAFDTGSESELLSEQAAASVKDILDGFVRVSLANSEENILIGIEQICELLDECEANTGTNG